jgi:hypothetical protein
MTFGTTYVVIAAEMKLTQIQYCSHPIRTCAKNKPRTTAI